jgi:hypothetical protein
MSRANTERRGQQERILDLLKTRGYGNWVERYEFLDLQPRICDFTTRIFELRWQRDFNIECRTRRVDGITHSAYRLLPGRWRDLLGKPEGYSPRSDSFECKMPQGKSWDEIVAEREEKMRQAEPSFELTP